MTDVGFYIRLTPAQLRALDKLAREKKATRETVARRILAKALGLREAQERDQNSAGPQSGSP